MDFGSIPHYLPWKNTPKPEFAEAKKLASWLWVDSDTLDPDDDWEAKLVPEEAIHAARETQIQNRGLLQAKLRAFKQEVAQRKRQHNGLPAMPEPEPVAESVYSGNTL